MTSVDQRAVIAEGVRHRESHRDSMPIRGLNQIDIAVRAGLSYEAENRSEPGDSMHIGEPVERGGDGSGATPLSHFLTGAGACLLNQFVRIAIADELPIRFLGASVRGEFRREAGGRFERIACEVRAEGSIDARAAGPLITRAERLCYVHQTLVDAVAMTTVLIVNGQEVGRHVDGPAPSTS